MTRTALPYRFAGGPSADQLQEWVDNGYTNTQIADIAGRLYGTEAPAKQTVANWLKRAGIVRSRRRAPDLDHDAVRPWRVRSEHAGDGIDHRLYEYSRRLHGVKLDATTNRRLDEFLDYLREHDRVVDYDPESVDGWCLRPRDPRVDDPESIIRRPENPEI